MITSLQVGSREAVSTMNASQVSSEDSVEVANQAGARLISVTQRIEEIDGMNQSVAAATEEQTAVVESLNVDINQINLLNQQGVVNLNETLKDCDALSQQASRLKLNRPGFSRHSQGSLRNAFQTLPVTADC